MDKKRSLDQTLLLGRFTEISKINSQTKPGPVNAPFSLLFRCLNKTVYPSPGDIRLNTNYLYTGRSAILKLKQNTQTAQTKNMVYVQRIEKG